MDKFTVVITDSKDQWFRIRMALPFNVNTPGTWEALDLGYITFTKGWTGTAASTGSRIDREVRLFSDENTWGLQMDDMLGILWSNSKGEGWLVQAWALGAEPGKIAWSRV